MSGSRDKLTLANQAFVNGDAQEGLRLLREYNASNQSDAGSWHRQAIIEEQIGEFRYACQAHAKCIEIAPNNAIGYLYGGYCLQQRGQLEAAASLYSLAYDLDPSALALGQAPNVSAPTQQRSRQANTTMRAVFSQHHRDQLSGVNGCQKIIDAQWRQTNEQEIIFSTTNFAPELFYIQGLREQAFYSGSEFKWAKQLCAKQEIIAAELTSALAQQTGQSSLRPYLQGDFSSHPSLKNLANSSNWQAIDLYRNGQLNTELKDSFKHTFEALEAVPSYNLDTHPFECFFSVLKPGQSIAPHFGQSNHALTVHMSIDIPEDCYLQVDEQQMQWLDNELLIFDDSFLHSAHNNSKNGRIVLIFSIWHPDLSDAERDAIQVAFKARQALLERRPDYLKELALLV